MFYALSSLPARAQLPSPPTDLTASFSVRVDAPHDLIHYIVAGFFDAGGVDSVRAAQAEAERQLTCDVGRHVTLLDISGCRIQSRDTMARFADMLTDPCHRGRALAVVVGGSLARSQIARAVGDREVSYFATAIGARTWLLRGDPPLRGSDPP